VLLYEGDRQADDGRVQVASVSAFTALLLGDDIAAGVEVKNERSDSRTTIAGVTDVQRRTFASGAVFVRSNTLDRATFPTRGHLLSLRSERTLGRASNAFTQHVAHAQIALPLSRSLAAHARATFGSSSPEAALPLHYLFMLGGAYPSQLFPETQIAFAGLRPQERVGAAVSRLGVALQWEASQNVFATLRADAGYVGRTLTLNADAYTLGVGFALGALTPVGPVELSGGVRPRGGRPRLELSLGYPF
jgi:outer membrane protein assembly factor BamA